jgi:YggT family protein
MMENSVHALVFIINTVLGLYTAAVLLRFLMQQVRADFYNPLAKAMMKLTDPLLLPLRRVIRPWNRIDLASLVLVLVLQFGNVLLVTWLANRVGYSLAYGPGFLLMWIAIKLVYILVNLYFFTILVEVLMSWFNQGRSPMDSMIRPVNAPLLRPVRRVLPPFSGLDFSPLVVLLILQVISYFFMPHIWPFMGI